jgi:hypothetical protein
MEVLRLSDDQHQWLRTLSSETLFADGETFLLFVRVVAESLLTSKDGLKDFLGEFFRLCHSFSRLIGLNSLPEDSSKVRKTPENLLAIHQGVAGLSSIFVEAAKRNSAADAVG